MKSRTAIEVTAKRSMIISQGIPMHSIILLLLAVFIIMFHSAAAITSVSAQYVGRAKCASCHSAQAELWSGSHHDLAMQLATESTVLGDFADTKLTHFGVTSSFFKKNGKFMVRTENADGKLEDFVIKYTFGAHPLQQYLIEFPGGRMQALSLAWDTRAKEQGGQRWFHLYPNEKIAHNDELHWTKLNQNWNSMCAECHSTHLEKNYDPVSKTFSTTWSEINVSCEACHGPGSDHVNWAVRKPGWEAQETGMGLKLLLDERKDIQWKINPESGKVYRSKARSSDKEIEMCARCHSRRSPISRDYVHGERLLDHYLPSRLDQGMYFADGQMNDEVYVYGSFVQSKMYQAGVTCSDCHQPHSLDLNSLGNGVCLQCHQADKYNNSSHHFHKPGSLGGSCAECHMPPRTYMVVDPRHDHSMRIPRPDLSVKLGTPNACNHCHQDKSSEWAAEQVANWYGRTPKGFQPFATALHAARNQIPDAGSGLAALIRNTQTPDIVRATALAEIGHYLQWATVDVLTAGMGDDNPMVRAATLTALEAAPSNLQVRLAWQLLSDPVRAVRIEAARLLATIPAGELSQDKRTLLVNGVNEYIESQLAMAERPEAQINLGNLYVARGEADKAVTAYLTATALDPRYVAGYVNLAHIYGLQGDETAAENTLRQAARSIPDNSHLQHALGLSLVRQKRADEAVAVLRQAARLNPENARYVYVYAVALNSTGDPKQAIMVLQGAHNAHPNNVDILNALIAFNRDLGNHQAARAYARKLKRLSP